MAEQRGLRGWVRNRSDGTVEVLAEGEPEALDDLARLLAAGPPASSVTEVIATPADVRPHTSFSVQPSL